MEFEEYRNIVEKRASKGQFKIRGSFGVYDCYKLMRKNKWYDIGTFVREKDYYAIIRGINNLLAENISNGISVKFPWGMGDLEIFKIKPGVSFVNGKLKNTYPIAWNETLKLWYEDEEARRMKTLVRNEWEYVYFIKYVKHNANYPNQSFYQFVPNRFAKIALVENSKKGKIETLYGN